ncbi:type III secretion system protein SctP [Burkholderia sp. BCC1977]|uniref:type III secretion system protein SctP n=1 Tax=Burkholderia sp. BCC1977 TaxID=2817440 RepID=UPI002ABDFAEE|nr:type III secretion system protein SctP [Burkholderia sp. BCC1977]
MTLTRRAARAVRIHALPAPATGPQSADAARRARFAALRGSAGKLASMRDDGDSDAPQAAAAPRVDVCTAIGAGRGQTGARERDPSDTSDAPDASDAHDAPDAAGLSGRIALACLQESRARLTAERIAARVAEFCNTAAVRQHGAWSARLRLDPNLLPDTLLSMTLSPPCLSLRFETAHAQSRQLICAHQDTLRTTLEAALHGGYELDVDVG